jgi:hypothetical protein
MSERWSSARFRRRFFGIGGALTLVTAVVVTVALLGNTAKKEPDTRRPGVPWRYQAPQVAHLTRAERVKVLQTSMLFIDTAVARKHLERAYPITDPELLQGMSKREWVHGNIPVVPFPVAGVAAWDVAYEYRNDVALQFSLVAKPGSQTVLGKTFTIELKRSRAAAPWRVVSWSPTGISGPSNDPKQAAALAAGPPAVKAALTMWWLALPLGMLALIVLIPTGLALRSWYLGRKFEREYLAERGY